MKQFYFYRTFYRRFYRTFYTEGSREKKLAKFYQTFGPFSIELLWLSIEPSVEGYIEPSAEGSIEPSTEEKVL